MTVGFEHKTPYYYVEIDGSIIGSKVKGISVEYFNGNAYALGGSVVELVAPDGYEFTSVLVGGAELQVQEDGKYLFNMDGSSTVIVSGTVRKVGIKQTTVHSAVDFTYDGVSYTSEDTVTLNDITEGESTLKTISAEGYVFIGWAYEDGGTVSITNSSLISYSAYYAVWALERGEISSYGFNENGNSLSDVTVNVNADNAQSFYGWYAYNDSDFEKQLNSVSLSETVLYARVNYKLTYTLKGSSGSDNYFYYNGDNVNDKSSIYGSENTKVINVLEGTSVQVGLADNNTQLVISYNNGAEESARAKKRGGWPMYNPGSSRTFTLPDVSEITNSKVNKNLSFTVTF